MPDSYTEFDNELNAPGRTIANPWALDPGGDVVYEPDYGLLERLLSLPVTAGASTESGRLAKALDVWMADELRRAGFGEDEVWPRRREPRIIQSAAAELERHLIAVEEDILAKEARPGRHPSEVMMPSLRTRIFALRKKIPSGTDAHVLGRFYNKQIDTVIAHPERGPIIMISGKTMTSDFSKNIPNRFEEAIGDGTNLKQRFPIAPLGFVILVKSTVFAERGAYARLDNLVRSVQTEAGQYDAATLIVADWNDPYGAAPVGWTPQLRVLDSSDPRIPSDDLAPSVFFRRLLERLFETTPVEFYSEARRRWGYTAPGAPLAPPRIP